jgi:hypothetical protein
VLASGPTRCAALGLGPSLFRERFKDAHASGARALITSLRGTAQKEGLCRSGPTRRWWHRWWHTGAYGVLCDYPDTRFQARSRVFARVVMGGAGLERARSRAHSGTGNCRGSSVQAMSWIRVRRSAKPRLLSDSTTERGHKTDTSETTRATSRDASQIRKAGRFAGITESLVIGSARA